METSLLINDLPVWTVMNLGRLCEVFPSSRSTDNSHCVILNIFCAISASSPGSWLYLAASPQYFGNCIFVCALYCRNKKNEE
jgi:hypothetical protein